MPGTSSRRLGPAWLLAVSLWLLLAGLSGCATTASTSAEGAAPSSVGTNPVDPFERFNRRMFAFNDRVDDLLLRPVAEAYRKWVPQLVRTGIGNVLGNVRDVWSAANQVLQGKPGDGAEMGMRVITNTVFGLGGLLDPAAELGLRRKSEDFGQTLGTWGLGTGPYLVLPILGPSTLRDAAALPLDMSISASSLPRTSDGQLAVSLISAIDVRANLLATTRLAGEVALDRYSFFRDAFLARRLDQVYDGNPPLETFEDEPEEGAARKPAKDGASGAPPAAAPKPPASAPRP